MDEWMDGFSVVITRKKRWIFSTSSSSLHDGMNRTRVHKLNFVTRKVRCRAKTPQQLTLSPAGEGVHKQHFKFWSRTCQTFAYQMFHSSWQMRSSEFSWGCVLNLAESWWTVSLLPARKVPEIWTQSSLAYKLRCAANIAHTDTHITRPKQSLSQDRMWTERERVSSELH